MQSGSRALLVVVLLAHACAMLAAPVFVCDESGANHTLTVRAALWRRGWVENKRGWSSDYDLKWTWAFGRAKLNATRLKHNNQYINHFPHSGEMTNKDLLAANLLATHPRSRVERIVPATYDLTKAEERDRLARDANNKQAAWIAKPARFARGVGIQVFDNYKDLENYTSHRDVPFIVQHYLHPPYLIRGHKFDLRVFVLVTSIAPLTVHMYTKPYVRFCSGPYDITKPDDKFRHLTNHQVQKNSNYAPVAPWNQWSIDEFRAHLREHGSSTYDEDILPSMKEAIADVAMVLPSQDVLPRMFELFGFDILLDDKLHPWVIEVNLAPGLHMITDVVRDIYPAMVDQMFEVVLGEKLSDGNGWDALVVTGKRQDFQPVVRDREL